MPRAFIASVLTLAAISLAGPVLAAPSSDACQPAEKMAASLANDYQELPIAVMIGDTVSGTGLVVLFANTGTGTWTLTLATGPDELCTIGAGENFRLKPQPIPGQDVLK